MTERRARLVSAPSPDDENAAADGTAALAAALSERGVRVELAELTALADQTGPTDQAEVGAVPDVWLRDDVLPPTPDLIRPGGVLPVPADSVRWVLCSSEDRRAAVEWAFPEIARRTAVVEPSDATALSATVERLVRRTWPDVPALAAGPGGRPLRVLFASHDFTFATELIAFLRAGGADVRLDHVAVFARQDEAASRELLAWADVAVVEWCSPLAAWYATHRPDGVRLVVRLHRAELYTDWPAQVDINRVDRVVCVSPHYAALTVSRTGWPADKVVAAPNYVDCALFDRPKYPAAVHHLGFIGVVPSRKRFDLALDVLEELRRDDPRFRLFVKTKMPWEYSWNWNKPEEREVTAALLRRIQTSPLLRDAVVFDPHGADVAAWLRKIGWVLSTSDDESFHLAPAEGMASGAVPVLRDWPGVDTIYDPEWICAGGPAAMAERIRTAVADGTWATLGARAQAQLRGAYDVDVAARRFVDVLTGSL